MNETIQNLLGAFLSAHGKHSLAAQAYESTDRNDWVRLGDDAIRSAPEYNRTSVAFQVKKALDNPTNGGPGIAAKFVIALEVNPLNTDVAVYRAYRLENDNTRTDLGLAHHEMGKIARRIVGMYVASEIQYPTEVTQ